MTWTPDKYTQVLHDALRAYDGEHPHWHAEVLVSLIQWALRRLEHHVELETKNDIDWNSPFIELHFPVEWDWEATRHGKVSTARALSGSISEENTANETLARKTLAEIMVRHLNIAALQDLTNGAWFEKRDDVYTPFVPVETDKILKSIRSKIERRQALEELFRPFAIGAASVDIQTRKDGRLTKRSQRQLTNVNKLLDIRSIRFEGDVQGHEVNISLIFQIHPLIADYGLRRAYHPTVVGLFIEPTIVGNEIINSTPASWSKGDRKALWQELHLEVEKLGNSLIPRYQLERSTVISLNAELEVPVGGDGVGDNAAVEAVAKTLLTLGKIRHIAVKQQPQGPGSPPVIREEQEPPATLHEAFVRTIWKTKFRIPIVLFVLLLVTAFGIYAAQPSEIKIRIWNSCIQTLKKLFGG